MPKWILVVILIVTLLSLQCCAKEETKPPRREPIILIPGFASSRLMAWKFKSCGSGFNINIGDRVWLDVAHVLYDTFRESCWSACMMVDAKNQTDPPDCKLRPVSSIEAIGELDPGKITGPLSAIFRHIIDLLSNNYDYDTTNLAAAPYDWRLPPQVLEERDRYFSSLKVTIEELVHFNHKPAIIIAHSMGNNIFLYFTEWIKLQYPSNWQAWFDKYISSFFAVAAPLLGSAQCARGALSGQTFGLPISESAVRDFMVTFGSGPWMFPLYDPSPNITARAQGGWPHHLLTIDYQTDTYRSVNYTEQSLLDGTLWEDTSIYDPKLYEMGYMLNKFYKNAELNALVPPMRPPIQNVYAIYGINEPTEIGYHYRVIDEAFRLKKIIYERDGGEVFTSTALLNRQKSLYYSKWGKSGDGTVSYNSLNWAQTWHEGPVNTTSIPTMVDKSSRLHELQRLLGLEKWRYGQHRYFSEATVNGRVLRTAVIEIEHQNHRDIIRSRALLDLLQEELNPRTDVSYMDEVFPAQVPGGAPNVGGDLTAITNEEIRKKILLLEAELARREREENKNEQPKKIDHHDEEDGDPLVGSNPGRTQVDVNHRDDDEGSEFHDDDLGILDPQNSK